MDPYHRSASSEHRYESLSSPSLYEPLHTRNGRPQTQHATRDHTGGGEWNADKAVSATATQPETYGSGAAYDDACFFFVRLTLSRLSTCSSVCELSMICHGKGSQGGLSVIYTHEHRRSRSHATAPPPGAVAAALVQVLARPHARQVEWPCRIGGAAQGGRTFAYAASVS